MPSGKTHAKITVALAVPVGLSTLYYSTDWSLALMSSIGCLTGLLLTPDLDLTDKMPYISNKLPYPFKGIWEFYWRCYGKKVPHRHWVSHGFVVSTFIRLFYLFWWIFPVTGWEIASSLMASPYSLAAVYGLLISDGAHLITDKVGSWKKRRERIRFLRYSKTLRRGSSPDKTPKIADNPAQ